MNEQPETITVVPATMKMFGHRVPGFLTVAIEDDEGYKYAFAVKIEDVDNPKASTSGIPVSVTKVTDLFPA